MSHPLTHHLGGTRMPKNQSDSPKIQMEPVRPDPHDGVGHDGHSAWVLRVDGREVRRFPNREAAQRFAYREIRASRL
jgi:hypothetical protein